MPFPATLGLAPDLDPQEPVEVRVNAEDRIVRCNPAWDRFARRNGAPELRCAEIHGLRLLESFSGKVTRRFMQALLDRVRRDGEALTLPYRCDSPRLRRFMRMEILPGPGNDLLLRHWLLRLETLPRSIRITSSPQRDRHTHLRCSLCGLIKQGENWVEPLALAAGLPPRQMVSLQVTYGICPTCEALVAVTPGG